MSAHKHLVIDPTIKPSFLTGQWETGRRRGGHRPCGSAHLNTHITHSCSHTLCILRSRHVLRFKFYECSHCVFVRSTFHTSPPAGRPGRSPDSVDPGGSLERAGRAEPALQTLLPAKQSRRHSSEACTEYRPPALHRVLPGRPLPEFSVLGHLTQSQELCKKVATLPAILGRDAAITSTTAQTRPRRCQNLNSAQVASGRGADTPALGCLLHDQRAFSFASL